MYLHSPLNYSGGKYTLLSQLLPLFPPHAPRFLDLFCGGLNVSLNVSYPLIYANDKNPRLIELYQVLKANGSDSILFRIHQLLKQYQLTPLNQDGYLRMRHDYNEAPDAFRFLLLIFFGFNHQIRFNQRGGFNTPFGRNKGQYNFTTERNLLAFIQKLQETTIFFSDKDFRAFPYSLLQPGDFAYCDPPYLISTGMYNDGKRGFGGWNAQDDANLRDILDQLNQRGICFALSNVFWHKGKEHTELIEWSQKYFIHPLTKDYRNCSYQLKTRDTDTQEVLITNYAPKSFKGETCKPDSDALRPCA